MLPMSLVEVQLKSGEGNVVAISIFLQCNICVGVGSYSVHCQQNTWIWSLSFGLLGNIIVKFRVNYEGIGCP